MSFAISPLVTITVDENRALQAHLRQPLHPECSRRYTVSGHLCPSYPPFALGRHFDHPLVNRLEMVVHAIQTLCVVDGQVNATTSNLEAEGAQLTPGIRPYLTYVDIACLKGHTVW